MKYVTGLCLYMNGIFNFRLGDLTEVKFLPDTNIECPFHMLFI